MGVIPGLVSIPVVKSFCVLFVYYGFLWEFHFAASLLYYNYLLIFICFFICIIPVLLNLGDFFEYKNIGYYIT